jgi:DnaK suppressor protein
MDHPIDHSGAGARLRAERRETERRLGYLTGTFTDIVKASESSNADDEHDPEGATIAFERSQVDALVRQAQEHLAELDAAEARVAGGTYGICESCGQSVTAARLEARPTARTCISCAGGSRRAVRRPRG